MITIILHKETLVYLILIGWIKNPVVASDVVLRIDLNCNEQARVFYMQNKFMLTVNPLVAQIHIPFSPLLFHLVLRDQRIYPLLLGRGEFRHVDTSLKKAELSCQEAVTADHQ